jgi:hypothetical protein
MLEPPHCPWMPNAGLLESPNRPLGKSSQVVTLLKSLVDAVPSVCIRKRESAAVVAALVGVIRWTGSVSGMSCQKCRVS